MTNGGADERDGMDPRDDRALWSLLGQQPPPGRVSPYFARRVLREVALSEERRSAGWLARVFGFLPGGSGAQQVAVWSTACAVVCVAVLATVGRPMTSPHKAVVPQREANVVAAPAPAGSPEADDGTEAVSSLESVPVKEVEVIADLDNILQREESRLWTEDTARF